MNSTIVKNSKITLKITITTANEKMLRPLICFEMKLYSAFVKNKIKRK